MASVFSIGCVFAVFYTILLQNLSQSETICQKGLTCAEDPRCCDDKNHSSTSLPTTEATTSDMNALHNEPVYINGPWYSQWPTFLVLSVLVSIFLGCMYCTWTSCNRYLRVFSCFCACCMARMRRTPSDRDSAGSCYPPPRYSRCSSLYRMPPPYSEVQSKPDMYPLVITCGNADKGTGGYLMVQYIRNYATRPTGSVSAASTAESLNSSYICNAANEANSIIPPPYSFANNYDEWRDVGYSRGSILRSLSSLSGTGEPRSDRVPPRSRTAPSVPPPRKPLDMSPEESYRHTLITSPEQDTNYDWDFELIDYDMRSCGGTCRPKLGHSPPVRRSPEEKLFNDVEHLRMMFTTASPDTPCASPPRPISPTQFSGEYQSYAKRRSEQRPNRNAPALCKASLYMSFSDANKHKKSPNIRSSSKSAPATPSSMFGSTVLSFPQRLSGATRLEEEGNPLLENHCGMEHKF